jgi:hypothetical protein
VRRGMGMAKHKISNVSIKKISEALIQDGSFEIQNISYTQNKLRLEVKFLYRKQNIDIIFISRSDKLVHLYTNKVKRIDFHNFIGEMFQEFIEPTLEENIYLPIKIALKIFLFEEIKKNPKYKMQCLYDSELKEKFEKLT